MSSKPKDAEGEREPSYSKHVESTNNSEDEREGQQTKGLTEPRDAASEIDGGVHANDKHPASQDGVDVEVSTQDASQVEADGGTETPEGEDETLEASSLLEEEAPPLPQEKVPPLPSEPVPGQDDGWAPVWEPIAQAFYFYNRFTGATQWTNPRVPDEAMQQGPPGVESASGPRVPTEAPPNGRPAGGYDPAIHGDYDPEAWYAQPAEAVQEVEASSSTAPVDPEAAYAATGHFNRFTGRWQAAEVAPENYNDENKSKRQMNAFFDVDATANSHDGRSLKAERSGKKLSKQELKQFKEKRKAKKEEKRRAWLRD